ncbi:MAG: hypothetical protein ACW99Q_00240, partial [Candidatus Kariarchaeaceae archaeon]
FTTWLNIILNPLVDAYGTMLAGFPLNILSYLVSAILLALFMQVVFALLPPVRAIVDTIMVPFRIIHIWLHIQAARDIIDKRNLSGDKKNFSLSFVSFFSTGFGTKSEQSAIALNGLCSPKEASRIANAPLKGTLVLLLMLTLLTPLLRTTFIGKLIHLYIFIGVVTTSFPSGSDYKYTYNMLLMNSQINFSWLLLPVGAFSSTFIVILALTENVIFAILWGVAATSLCTWLLLMENIRKTDIGDQNIDNIGLKNYSTTGGAIETDHTDTNSSNTPVYFFQLEKDSYQ